MRQRSVSGSGIIAAILAVALAFTLCAASGSASYAAGVEKSSKKVTAAKKVTFNERSYRKLRSKTVSARGLGINLREMIGEPYSGYAVVQGGCTDGRYAYYLMVSSDTQHGRVLKVRMRDNKVVRRSKVLDIWHGNGMTYDSKRKRLVVIACEHRRQEITCIDAKTLRITKQRNVRYSHYRKAKGASLTMEHQLQGLSAIAYVKKYDCYVALERTYRNLIVFNPDTFQAEGFILTDILGQYPGTFQGMDADEKYVYLLLSEYQEDPDRQPNNLILALDWNSERMLPVVNAGKNRKNKYVKKWWRCNNDRSGRPDAVIRLPLRFEAENIYHTPGKRGKGHFYVSEYYGRHVYYGGWYWGRDDYVYDLGMI